MNAMADPDDVGDRDRLMGLTENVDDKSRVVASRVAPVLVIAVRALRIPSAIVWALPLPFIGVFAVLVARADGLVRIAGLVGAALMIIVSAAFWGRRRRILQAVEDPERLATELGIMISLSDKAGETRSVLSQIAGGGWQIFSRLKGLWSAASMTGRWIDNIGDLPRARYFAPPKIGTTVAVTVTALWLIPISIVVALLTVIASIAGTL